MLQGFLCSHFQPAAARDFHADNRDTLDVVLFENLRQLLTVVDRVEFRAADQRDLPLHKFLVQIRIRKRGAVRRDEQLCVLKIRRVHRDQLNLTGPLPEPGRGGRRHGGRGRRARRSRAVECMHRAAGASRKRCFRESGRLLLCRNRSLIVIGRLALFERDGTRRAGRQAIAQAVTVVIAQKLCLPVDHPNRALVAGCRAGTAAIAFFFLNLDDFSNHR